MNQSLWLVSALAVYGAVFGGIIWHSRRFSRKAKVKRRLLVKDEDGQLVWRTVKGRMLVGYPDLKGVVTSGYWASFESDKWGDSWAVLQAAKGKLVVYRFDRDQLEGPHTGVIQVCDSWRELESVVPAKILEAALLEAGIEKPSEYRDVPLEL
jgi:hypothetical protein